MKCRLKVREFSIGPAHDPYGASEYTLEHGEDTTTYYRDGLYSQRVTHNGKVVFQSYGDEEVQERTALRIFELMAGISYNQFNRAYERLNPYFEDPMGNPSDYI